MAKVIFGNHSSVIVPVQDRESIRRFYCDVLGGTLTKAQPERDFVRLGEDFYIAFLYGDVPDESEFLRSARAVWLELKSATSRRPARKSSSPVWSGSSIYPILTSISRLRAVNASDWSAVTRTSPSTRGRARAQTWQG